MRGFFYLYNLRQVMRETTGCHAVAAPENNTTPNISVKSFFIDLYSDKPIYISLSEHKQRVNNQLSHLDALHIMLCYKESFKKQNNLKCSAQLKKKPLMRGAS